MYRIKYLFFVIFIIASIFFLYLTIIKWKGAERNNVSKGNFKNLQIYLLQFKLSSLILLTIGLLSIAFYFLGIVDYYLGVFILEIDLVYNIIKEHK